MVQGQLPGAGLPAKIFASRAAVGGAVAVVVENGRVIPAFFRQEAQLPGSPFQAFTLLGLAQHPGDVCQGKGFTVKHGRKSRAFGSGDGRALPAGLPDGEGRVIFQAGLEGMVPFREAVLVAVVAGVEPALGEGLQPGLDCAQEIRIEGALIGLPGQAGEKRGSQPAPALTGQAGFPIHAAICGLHGQEVTQQTGGQFRSAGQETGQIDRPPGAAAPFQSGE